MSGEIEGSPARLFNCRFGGAVAQLGARLDGIEEVVGSNPIGSTNFFTHITCGCVVDCGREFVS